MYGQASSVLQFEQIEDSSLINIVKSLEGIHQEEVITQMDVKLVLVVLTIVFTVSSLIFGTKNGFYDSDNYHGNGSAH
jgi:hypothetical protein